MYRNNLILLVIALLLRSDELDVGHIKHSAYYRQEE